jgi:hypothetical protein
MPETHRSGLAFGWADFDQALVARIAARDRAVVDTSPQGGIRCPLVSHDGEWLPWRDGKARNGTEWHADSLRFHASPTFVLRERLDNIIVGHALAQEALDGKWQKAETHRLGHENSEDALTWNVFRSLQEADALGLAVSCLGGIEPVARPRLFVWGREILGDGTRAWPKLTEARNDIEPRGGQQTEPDCCIHVPGQVWLFIEAKFGSRTATPQDERAKHSWLDRYEQTCPGLFNRDAISKMPAKHFPEQLCRNVALALRIRQPRETVIVVALVRKAEAKAVHLVARQCVDDGERAEVREATWESLHRSIERLPALASLRSYCENKSYRLRKAFAI